MKELSERVKKEGKEKKEKKEERKQESSSEGHSSYNSFMTNAFLASCLAYCVDPLKKNSSGSLQERTPSEVTEATLAQSEDSSILQGGKIESLEVHQGMIAKPNTLSSCDEHSDVSSVSLGTFIDSNNSLSCEDTLDSDSSFFDSLNDLFAYEEALI